MTAWLPIPRKRFAKTATFISAIANKWWAKFGILPLLATAPAGAVNLYLSEENLRPAIANWLPDALLAWMFAHPIKAHLLAPAWSWAILLLYAYLATRKGVAHPVVVVEKLMYLHQVLETVVSSKAKRFGGFVKDLLTNNQAAKPGKSAQAAFDSITQPDQQIALLTRALHSFFSYYYPETSLRVGVAAIENNSPADWFFWYPEEAPPRTPIEALRDERSAMSRCIKKKDIFIVEDIQKSSRGRKAVFIHARDGAEKEEGSLICFPIVHNHSKDVPYVINIIARNKGVFKIADAALYKWMIDHFSLRMGLEHSLLLIKRECTK